MTRICARAYGPHQSCIQLQHNEIVKRMSLLFQPPAQWEALRWRRRGLRGGQPAPGRRHRGPRQPRRRSNRPGMRNEMDFSISQWGIIKWRFQTISWSNRYKFGAMCNTFHSIDCSLNFRITNTLRSGRIQGHSAALVSSKAGGMSQLTWVSWVRNWLKSGFVTQVELSWDKIYLWMLIKRGYFRANFNEIWPERLDLPMRLWSRHKKSH